MSLPPVNHPCWQRLASGGLGRIQTQHLGTQLMSKRLERSSDSMSAKCAEIYAFFSKWERTLSQEIEQLARI